VRGSRVAGAQQAAESIEVPSADGTSRRAAVERRRSSILDAALVVIARSGFAGTTLRDVAAEAGVAHGLLRHHFGSREALLAAAFDRAAGGQIAGWVAPTDDPLVALVEYFEPLAVEHWLLWVDAWSEAPRNPELAGTLIHHHRACEAYLRRVIVAGSDAGVLRCADPDEAVGLLAPLQDGLAVQEFALGVVDRRTADRRAMTMVALLLGLDDEALRRARRRRARRAGSDR
jgi:AcrR family transcriptional regulator